MDHSWKIDTRLVELGITITEMYIDSLISISENLEPDEDSRTRKKIIEYLNECDMQTGTLGEFIRQYRVSVSSAKIAIEWLSCAGYITKFEDVSVSFRIFKQKIGEKGCREHPFSIWLKETTNQITQNRYYNLQSKFVNTSNTENIKP